MLNHNIKGTGITVSDELHSYAKRRLSNAEKFLQQDPSVHVDIELEYSALRDGEKYRAEFTVAASGHIYRASKWGESMHAAIDLAVGELVAELGRNKKKRLHVLRRGGHRIKEYLRGWRDSL